MWTDVHDPTDPGLTIGCRDRLVREDAGVVGANTQTTSTNAMICDVSPCPSAAFVCAYWVVVPLGGKESGAGLDAVRALSRKAVLYGAYHPTARSIRGRASTATYHPQVGAATMATRPSSTPHI